MAGHRGDLECNGLGRIPNGFTGVPQAYSPSIYRIDLTPTMMVEGSRIATAFP